jgi:hypothetical protein
VKYILLHGHTRHVGRVQAPNVEVAFAKLLLDPVRRKAIQVHTHKRLGNPLGSVLSLPSTVATKDEQLWSLVK